jgi:group II intron reverse transcriptase/maturase
MDLDWMREAYRRTRKNGAVGVDGQTAKDYEANLDANLEDLLSRAKSGRFRAQPVRRTYIPKGNGETRPLGIPTLEDKILQRAVTMLLEPVYEQDFLDCNYGFRPGLSPHKALKRIRDQIVKTKGCYVIDADIRQYFDTLDHACLRDLLDRRIRDGVIRRLIHKWLKAGIMEEERIEYPDAGVPQGGVISPLLSNIYLHYVLDQWICQDLAPSMNGTIHLVRFADDFILMMSDARDAPRVMEALPKRFEKYGLTIHPDKTRLVPFFPHVKHATFVFLGFTHYWGKARRGGRTVKRKTARKKRKLILEATNEWCAKNRHKPIAWQHKQLSVKLRGRYQYYGICGNFRCLKALLWFTERIWKKWLSRRSRKRDLNWEKFGHYLAAHPLPKPRIYHRLV